MECNLEPPLFCFFSPAVRAVTWHRHIIMETSGLKHTPQSPFATLERCSASGLVTTWYACLLSIISQKKKYANLLGKKGKELWELWKERHDWETGKTETREVCWHRRGGAADNSHILIFLFVGVLLKLYRAVLLLLFGFYHTYLTSVLWSVCSVLCATSR